MTNAKHDGARPSASVSSRCARAASPAREPSTPPSSLIEQAKRDGADYVQTPEMTNIMEVRRDNLFAAIVAEEQDATLAAFRELARAARNVGACRLAGDEGVAGRARRTAAS